MMLQNLNVMSSFNRISYRVTSFGIQISSLWLLWFSWFLLSSLQNWVILMILPFSNFVFSVFQNTKKTPATRNQDPKHLDSKIRNPKNQDSICWNPHYQDSKTWCRILKTNVKRRVIFAISIQFIRCLRLFKNVCKKVLLCENWNPGQNIWHKVTKYSKIGQDFKNVISYFACFLTAIVNV